MSVRVFKFISSLVFGVIILLAIGGYFFVRNFDLNKYKSYAEEIVEKQTGRKLRINGDAKIAISLIPTIVINDVELANAEWATVPQMIKVKQAKMKFALLPLLKKEIVIDEVEIVAPEIYLEKSATGESNWEFKISNPVKNSVIVTDEVKTSAKVNVPAAAVMAGFVAKNVDIYNGTLQYNDVKTGAKNTIDIKSIIMSAPAYDANMTMKFDIVYNQQNIKGETEFGSLEQLFNSQNPFPFWIDVTALGADFDASGSVLNITSAPHYAAEVNIYNPAANYNLPETTLKTKIEGDTNGLKAEIATLNIVNNNITGNIDVGWSDKTPQINADLYSNKINLKNFSNQSNFAFEFPKLMNEAQALTFVPNTIIPYGVLKQFGANLKIKLGELVITQGMSAKNINADVLVKNGILVINPLNLEFGGGLVDAILTANANNKTIDVKINSNDLLLQNLYDEFAVSGDKDFGIKSGGVVDLDVNVKTNGDTYRALSQNLNGRLIAIVGKSEVQTGALQFLRSGFIAQLLSVLNIKTGDNPNLDMNCAVLRSDFNNGKAEFPKGIVIDSKQLTVVGDGNINLINDKISFTIEPQFNKLANGNLSQALASFVKIVGTLQNPQIKLDDKEALKTIIGVAATGGATYLGSQMLAYGGGEPCYVALEGTSYASRFPKPTGVVNATKDVYKDTSKQIKDGIEGLQNVAKDILNMFANP